MLLHAPLPIRRGLPGEPSPGQNYRAAWRIPARCSHQFQLACLLVLRHTSPRLSSEFAAAGDYPWTNNYPWNSHVKAPGRACRYAFRNSCGDKELVPRRVLASREQWPCRTASGHHTEDPLPASRLWRGLTVEHGRVHRFHDEKHIKWQALLP